VWLNTTYFVIASNCSCYKIINNVHIRWVVFHIISKQTSCGFASLYGSYLVWSLGCVITIIYVLLDWLIVWIKMLYVIHWLFGWLIYILIDRSIVRLTAYYVINWLIAWFSLIDRSIVWYLHWLASWHWLTEWLVLIDFLFNWSTDRSIRWITEYLTDWLSGCLTDIFRNCLIYWLIYWFIYYLIDW